MRRQLCSNHRWTKRKPVHLLRENSSKLTFVEVPSPTPRSGPRQHGAPHRGAVRQAHGLTAQVSGMMMRIGRAGAESTQANSLGTPRTTEHDQAILMVHASDFADHETIRTWLGIRHALVRGRRGVMRSASSTRRTRSLRESFEVLQVLRRQPEADAGALESKLSLHSQASCSTNAA